MTIPAKVKPLGSTGKFIHFLLVAGPGFGKTVTLGSEKKSLFLTTDPEGTVSAWMMGSEAKEWEIEGWPDLPEAYTYLRNGGIQELGLEWVHIDNISEAQELAKRENIRLERRGKENIIDEFVPTQGNYQRSQNMLLTMVKQFNDLPVNVSYTAWIATHEDEEGAEYFAPAIHGQQGAIAQMIAGYMNVVGYGKVIKKDGKDVRRIYFSQDGPYRGKDRFQALGNFKDDLTLPRMKDLIDKKIAARQAADSTKTSSGTRRGTTPTKAPAVRARTTRTRKA